MKLLIALKAFFKVLVGCFKELDEYIKHKASVGMWVFLISVFFLFATPGFGIPLVTIISAFGVLIGMLLVLITGMERRKSETK